MPKANKQNKSKFKNGLYSVIILFLLILIFFLIKGCWGQKDYSSEIKVLQANSRKILEEVWSHYKNHENFEADWWSGKFKHPKMITDTGIPWAFMDSVDNDNDGVKDINWSDPNKKFELVVVSESSSYALLRAIWMKDKKTFDKVWAWTKKNLQHSEMDYVYYWKDVNHPDNGWKTFKQLGIERDHLFAWRWVPTIAERHRKGIREDGVIYYRWQWPTKENNPNIPWRDGFDAASDADMDIAFSLIMADALWGSKKGDKYFDYATNAKAILKDLWDKETFVHLDKRYMAGGNNINDIEPGYLSPFSFRVFDDFDPDHNWMDLVDSSYYIFEQASIAKLLDWKDQRGDVHKQDPYARKRWPRANLLPDWVNLDVEGNVIDGKSRREPEFGTDAFRALWRIAVDYDWNKDYRAARYLKKKSPYGPYDFFNFRMNDSKGDWGKTKDYDESKKIASVFWHDGEHTFYESNYEPLEIKNYEENAYNSRANCAQYGVYLSYFWGSFLYKQNQKTFEMVKKLIYPLITPEADGFSKREYVIPEDQLAFETKQNIAKQVSLEMVNPKDDIGTPYSEGDGWYSKSSSGAYWTIFDHSEWNGQMDYFSNTWAWLGLAHFAGMIENFYTNKNKLPVIKDFDLFYDSKFEYKVKDEINADTTYLKAVGKDKNSENRDFFYVRIESTEPGAEPITVKIVETDKSSGIYVGKMKIGIKSSDAGDTIGATAGKEIAISVVHQKQPVKRYKVKELVIPIVLEDFENGSYSDANPLAWWTDSINPSSGKPNVALGEEPGIYIWKDSKWRVRFLGGASEDSFHGAILTDGEIRNLNKVGFENKDSVKLLKRSLDVNSFVKNDIDGIDFEVTGKYVIFDIKRNGTYDLNAFKIGLDASSAFGAPLILRNNGETGTYKLNMNENFSRDKFSLQINKNYMGKPYPYFGAVIFNEIHKDWSQFDEFKFDIFLKQDVGTIRVDIQDEDGTVVILNGYSPWDEKKGAGWYEWRSNFPLGVDINANLLQPFSIRHRNWWKGWDFDAGRNVEKTDKIDLTKIRNIMFCINGGNKDISEIIIDDLRLDRLNYNYGTNKPKNIQSIEVFKDKDYKEKLDNSNLLEQEVVYIKVTGKDSSEDTIDRFFLKVETTDGFPGCVNLDFEVLETGINTGVYLGTLRVGVYTDHAHNIIGASAGNFVNIFSDVNKFKNLKLKVAEFPIRILLDGFDDISAGTKPDSWWIDAIDPTDGRPIYAAGKTLGYYVWKEDGKWILRWSSDQKERLFEGSLESDGLLTVTKLMNVNHKSIVSRKSDRSIKFKAYEKYAEGGFDFFTRGSFVQFNLLIDGKKYPEKTFVGPNEWNKAYTIPFLINDYGRTKSYELMISNRYAVSPPNAMKITKTYFSKDYPYIGKWGLSGDLRKWDNKDELVVWVYLPQDVGTIRVDIEDSNRQTAVLGEYNPYDHNVGPGWYRWSSNHASGIAVAERAIDPKPIKDRAFWKSYNTSEEKYYDVTEKFKLDDILNIEFCIGGGEKKDVVVYLDDIYLVRGNKHVGFSAPKNIKRVNLYPEANPTKVIDKIIQNQHLILEIEGTDGDKHSIDKVYVQLETDDQEVNFNTIVIPLTETGSNTGVYRGKFSVGLRSSRENAVLGAAWGSNVFIKSPLDASSLKSYKVDLFELIHLIDDFEDGSVEDKIPVTWWIAGQNNNQKSYILNVKEQDNQKVLDVYKRYKGVDYPYFGAWGLKGEASYWSDKEDLVIEMYLKDNPGDLRVDIEDRSGVIAVLNGFSPWNPEKGQGKYYWRASVGKGEDFVNGLVDLKKINQRAWWKGWSNSYNDYIEVSRALDLSNIRNIQFMLDPGQKKDSIFSIGKIFLVNMNYRIGFSKPSKIKNIYFFKDNKYKKKLNKKGIKQNDLFMQVVGLDTDPGKVDLIEGNLMVMNDKNVPFFVKVKLTEYEPNSGIYRGEIDLQKVKDLQSGNYILAGDRIQLVLDDSNKSDVYRIISLQDLNKNDDGSSQGYFPWWIIILIIISGMLVYKKYNDSKKSKRK